MNNAALGDVCQKLQSTIKARFAAAIGPGHDVEWIERDPDVVLVQSRALNACAETEIELGYCRAVDFRGAGRTRPEDINLHDLRGRR